MKYFRQSFCSYQEFIWEFRPHFFTCHEFQHYLSESYLIYALKPITESSLKQHLCSNESSLLKIISLTGTTHFKLNIDCKAAFIHSSNWPLNNPDWKRIGHKSEKTLILAGAWWSYHPRNGNSDHAWRANCSPRKVSLLWWKEHLSRSQKTKVAVLN